MATVNGRKVDVPPPAQTRFFHSAIQWIWTDRRRNRFLLLASFLSYKLYSFGPKNRTKINYKVVTLVTQTLKSINQNRSADSSQIVQLVIKTHLQLQMRKLSILMRDCGLLTITQVSVPAEGDTSLKYNTDWRSGSVSARRQKENSTRQFFRLTWFCYRGNRLNVCECLSVMMRPL